MRDAANLGRLVLESDWTVAGALAIVEPHDVASAIERYANVPSLMQAEPAMNPEIAGSGCAELRKWLKPIGMTNWPDAKWDRSEWLSSTMLALSDLPAKVAVSATRQALHHSFRFPNEVQPAIREIAAEIIERHKLALHRLRMMHAEIQRAANPPVPQIAEEPKVWTQEEVEKMNAIFAKIGATTRWKLVDGEIQDANEKREWVDDRG